MRAWSEEALAAPTEGLPLDNRAKTCLLRLNAVTVKSVLALREGQILGFKGAGDGTVAAIVRALASVDLSVLEAAGQRTQGGYSARQGDAAAKASRGLEHLGEVFGEVVRRDWPEVALEAPIEQLPIGPRARNTLRRLGATTLGRVLALTRAQVLAVKGAGAGTVADIRRGLEVVSLPTLGVPTGTTKSRCFGAAIGWELPPRACDLPVTALRLTWRDIRLLHRLGLHTLGLLYALRPKDPAFAELVGAGAVPRLVLQIRRFAKVWDLAERSWLAWADTEWLPQAQGTPVEAAALSPSLARALARAGVRTLGEAFERLSDRPRATGGARPPEGDLVASSAASTKVAPLWLGAEAVLEVTGALRAAHRAASVADGRRARIRLASADSARRPGRALALPDRAARVFRRAGLSPWVAAERLTAADMLALPGADGSVLCEVQLALRAAGRRLPSDSADQRLLAPRRLGDGITDDWPSEAMDAPVTLLRLGVKEWRVLQLLGIDTIGRLAGQWESRILATQGAGLETVDRLAAALEEANPKALAEGRPAVSAAEANLATGYWDAIERRLPERARTVMRLRFGPSAGCFESQARLAEQLGVSRQRIGQCTQQLHEAVRQEPLTKPIVAKTRQVLRSLGGVATHAEVAELLALHFGSRPEDWVVVVALVIEAVDLFEEVAREGPVCGLAGTRRVYHCLKAGPAVSASTLGVSGELVSACRRCLPPPPAPRDHTSRYCPHLDAVFERERRPLHFRYLAEQIAGRTELTCRAETIHAVLRRLPTYARVAKGIFAPSAWGLTALPEDDDRRRIADVALDVLREHHGEMPREDLVAAVLQRKRVKAGSVRSALQLDPRFEVRRHRRGVAIVALVSGLTM